MQLKKLEISGFKSFMNRVDMDFSGGITAVLGPNGCGKTNIVDSIRWVLGEQKTRMLRNSKMENVIFNGTKYRRPLGMAEVHMTLTNEDHRLDLEFNEVKIARRLYRNGNSDYLINGKSARLKDIRSLLIDTGLGSNTYSIIEQEMVNSVISDKNNDKRALLEEAAGVARYRVQREEAMRKIKHTDDDLLRLGDILAELDKELRSLRYQLGKARRYQRLKEQVDIMEAILIKKSLYEILAKRDEVEKEKEHHAGITLADETEITKQEDELEKSRIESTELERKLQDLYEDRHELSQSLQQHEEKIAILNERITSLTNRIAEDDEEIERSNTKIALLSEELKEYHGLIELKETELSQRAEDLSEKSASLDLLTEELEALRTQLRDKKQIALDMVREKERKRGLREHLENRLQELVEKKQAAEQEETALRREEGDAVGLLAERDEQLTTKQEMLASGKAEVEAVTRKIEKVIELISENEDSYSASSIELNKHIEKKEYLERIKREHQGRDDALSGDRRILGVLADYVHVEKRFRSCFEACLAPVLPALVTESRDDAISCLRDLRERGGGRVQLVYPNGGRIRGTLPQAPGVVGFATDLISADAGTMQHLEPYLSDVVVVEDVDCALAVLSSSPSARVATLDGVFFDGTGRILVAGGDDIEMTLLEVDTKINEVEDAVRELEIQVERLAERKELLGEEKSRLVAELAEIKKRVENDETEQVKFADDKREAEVELARVREKIAAVIANIESETILMDEILEKLSAEPKTIESGDDLQAADDEVEGLEERARELERARESLTETVGQARLEVATIEGEIATAKEKRNNIEMLDTELRELVRARTEDAVRCRNDIEAAERDIVSSKSEIAGFHGRMEGIEASIEESKTQHEAVKVRCGELEVAVKELKGRRDSKRENLQRCDLELATITEKVSTLLEKANETFGQDLGEYLDQRDKFEPSEWEEMDHDTFADLKHKLDTFGPVNMLALEEFEEKKERFDFLSKQKADLEEAKDALIQAIRRINKEARKRLNETFTLVRENYKQCFATLFEGGQADLLFTDSDDPLEANIKMVANPKGKRLQDIASLSGGERALTALSLLFAIYLVKPSPFCVFDEVDAPLDDANIGRFVNMLRSFTDRTQFIIITHNKLTMEAADHLYGVTMEEPGVSRMISVHIGDVDEFQDRPIPTTRRQAKPPSEEVTV